MSDKNWTATMEMMRPDLRRQRAMALTAHILNLIREDICEHNDHKAVRRVHDKLLDALYNMGAEVVTDADRAEAGLQVRDSKGWTPSELLAPEERRLGLMRAPVVVFPAPQE